jgi:hypothetical protein
MLASSLKMVRVMKLKLKAMKMKKTMRPEMVRLPREA